MKPFWPDLIMRLIGITFWVIAFLISAYHTLMYTMIFISIILIISKLKGEI